jgi:hypothetical protein
MKLRILAALLALCTLAPARAAEPTWEVGSRLLPTVATNPCGAGYSNSPACGMSLHLDSLVIVNTTGSAVTVTITDVAATCSAAVCNLFVASIAANTTYTVDLRGERANQGFLWSASASGVNAWIAGH